jgi:DNA-directed RNA polymerase specialized sigma24 family protein
MRHHPTHMHGRQDEERLTAPQSPLNESSSPICPPKAVALWMLKVSEVAEQCLREISAYRHRDPSTDSYGVELLRRATLQGDQEAWAALQQGLAEVVRGWLHGHPSREVAVHLDSEDNYVAQAFERFWRATTQSQQVEFRTVAAALQYLRASLHGAILDRLRAYARPREISVPVSREPGEPHREDVTSSREVWDLLTTLLSNPRERRLAYLLFHCGLGPREIVHCCPQEFNDVHEVYCLRRNIMERLLRNADLLQWRLS